MDRCKTVIIGCGKVSHIHAKVLSAIEEAEFVAVYSRSEKKGNDFGELYHVRAYTDLNEMFERETPDVALICTPHPFHVESAVKAAENGIHVLVEKPLAASLPDCDTMIEAAKTNNVTLGVVFQRRWYPPVLRIRKAIDEGKIGNPILGTVTVLGWRDKKYYDSDPWRGTWDQEGGGVLVNQACHQLDLLQWFMGPIESVYGSWANFNHPYIEVDDTAAAVIHFKNGGIATITVSNSQNPPIYGNVHIFGDNGAGIGVETDRGAMFVAGMSEIEHPPVIDIWTIPEEQGNLSLWVEKDMNEFKQIDPILHFHSLNVKDFLCAIIEKREPLVTGEEGRKSVELFSAIYHSQKQKVPIWLPLS